MMIEHTINPKTGEQIQVVLPSPRGVFRCSVCLQGTRDPLHTDQEIRELCVALGWPIHGFCARCYGVLRAYRGIVRKSDKPKEAA